MNTAKEGDGEPVVARRQPAVVFEAAEHALDGVAAFVERAAEAASPAAVRSGRDIRDSALRLNLLGDAIIVVGAVPMDNAPRGQMDEKGFGGTAAGGLAGREMKGERATSSRRNGMDLRVSASTADADRLFAGPPFPPAAERCALACVLSISTSAGGPPAAARASNTWRQRPFSDQRLCQL